MARMVQCVKLGQLLPGLPRPPYPGKLGQRIYEEISAQAWNLWQQQKVVLINHYGLVLADPDAQQFMREQMEHFLFSPEERMPEGWVPEGSAGGKGAPVPAKK